MLQEVTMVRRWRKVKTRSRISLLQMKSSDAANEVYDSGVDYRSKIILATDMDEFNTAMYVIILLYQSGYIDNMPSELELSSHSYKVGDIPTISEERVTGTEVFAHSFSSNIWFNLSEYVGLGSSKGIHSLVVWSGTRIDKKAEIPTTKVGDFRLWPTINFPDRYDQRSLEKSAFNQSELIPVTFSDREVSDWVDIPEAGVPRDIDSAHWIDFRTVCINFQDKMNLRKDWGWSDVLKKYTLHIRPNELGRVYFTPK
ncbi:hypothetical protein KW783_02350 [Candidatus Parcubacteria bacterium]|nr:hypothetical protein [Candidatus Parcubacteria bacterium]